MKARILALAPLVLTATCDPIDWGPTQLGAGETSAELRQVQLGRDVYGTYCVGCHGEQGDGQGPAARFLDPKPRDFRLGRIKFASVSSGEAPRDEDYLRVLAAGLHGTAMPAFGLLPDREQRAVVAYVKSFYKDWQNDPPGAAIAIDRDPWADGPAAGVDAGRKAYHGIAKCWSCHPAYETFAEIAKINSLANLPPPQMRPNPYDAESKESQWGAPIRAQDFLADGVKNGIGVEPLVRVISAGVGGTAMPTWAGALEAKQLWGLAYYVRSLALLRGTPEGTALRQRLLAQPPPAPAPPATPPTQEEAQ